MACPLELDEEWSSETATGKEGESGGKDLEGLSEGPSHLETPSELCSLSLLERLLFFGALYGCWTFEQDGISQKCLQW